MEDVIESFVDGSKQGWLLQMVPTSVTDNETRNVHSALEVFLLSQDGGSFKVVKQYKPYFYIAVKESYEREVEVGLKGAFASVLSDVVYVDKDDLDLPNHLSGLKHTFLKLVFLNTSDLCQLRDFLREAVKKNAAVEAEALDLGEIRSYDRSNRFGFLEAVSGIREFDVKYHVRVSIDLGLRVGVWYNVTIKHGQVNFSSAGDLLQPQPRICAFDIECSKAPLKFPDAEVDPIYMISYMLDTQGYLIINREIVTEDIENFEYTPKAEYEGPFIVFNEKDEESLLRRWFDELKHKRPDVFVTFNGDFFDMPYISKRAAIHNIDMMEEIGFSEGEEGAWLSRSRPHIDCLYWVKRDSYLPQGSHGLKAVTKAKLGYDPLEINPEDMLRFAQEQPQHMASYSVSDAVATYYLYMKYVHPFIFSLCTIIPMPPDEVLRKGSGTCCEALLMVEAFQKNIIFPNKVLMQKEKFYNNHLLESETYIGGHVDSFRSGVFRADIPCAFTLDPKSFQTLIDKLDSALRFAIEVEGKLKLEEVENYEEVKKEILDKLISLRDAPRRIEKPLIYHLDVGAMYPNIILTNRLQPPSMVTEEDCAACIHNRPENHCQRPMDWIWRGEFFTANKSEYLRIKNQMETERFQPKVVEAAQKGNIKRKGRQAATPGGKKDARGGFNKPGGWKKPSLMDKMGTGSRAWGNGKGGRFSKFDRLHAPPAPDRAGGGGRGGGGDDEDDGEGRKPVQDPSSTSKQYHELDPEEQFSLLKKRLGEYSRKAHKKTYNVKEQLEQSVVCQRENPFFVDTVRAFRDRRYVYKDLTKKWKKEAELAAAGKGEYSLREAQSRCVLYESLQLAHKCILNSFYGYVMRKGSRWYSMEMGGVVTHLGANIIKMAHELVNGVGLALELDTDGIWCCLPASFPENFTFKTTNEKKKKYNISYPCVMLNADVAEKYTNHQYQDWVSANGESWASGKGHWETKAECSIFFEVDGPYLAMILPAAREEGKSIKKRYAVFNHDRSLAELKGFEIKRRGELKLIKVFQAQVFGKFLDGGSLKELYDAVGGVANDYLDILYTKGRDIATDELIDLIVESRTMSNALSDYGATQKSLALTCARRISELLGPQMVKDKGLSCTYVIAKQPAGEPVTNRAIPLAVFSVEEQLKRHFLAKWLRDNSIHANETIDIRDILDWEYYIERLNGAIQKIITIPAAMQLVPNPVPRVAHPVWLAKAVAAQNSRFRQNRIEFKAAPAGVRDIEDSFMPLPAKSCTTTSTSSSSSSSVTTRTPLKDRSVNIVAPSSEPEAPPIPAPSTAFMKAYFGPEATHTELDRSFFRNPEFGTWLASQQRAWRAMARDRRRSLQSISTAEELSADQPVGKRARKDAGAAAAHPQGLSQFIDNARSRLLASTWEVLEVRQSADLPPGVLKAFVLLDGSVVQTVKIQVPRLVYVNTRVPWEAGLAVGARPVSYTLPRRKRAQYLYELEIDESALDKVGALTLVDEVEGVYERNVSPAFRAMMQIGSICSVDQTAFHRRLNASGASAIAATINSDPIVLNDLATKENPAAPYLANSQLQYVYIYHSFSEADARGVIGVFFAKQQQARVVIVQAAQAPRQTAAQWARTTQEIVQRTQTQAMTQFGLDETEGAVPSEISEELAAAISKLQIEFQPPEYAADRLSAFRRVDGWMVEFLSVARPTLVFSQGLIEPETLMQQYMPILNTVPVRGLPAHKADAQIFRDASVYHVWVRQKALRMMEHYTQIVARQTDEMVQLCRYANIPLCNLAADRYVQMADVMFARALRMNSHLLWCSAAHRPDLGGNEGDDNKFSACEEVLSAMCPVDVNSPGAFHTYSVELEILHLEVKSVIHSQSILESEMQSMSLQHESNQVISAFHILRELVSNWFHDVQCRAPGCEVADQLLQTFFRWLKCKNAQLYDPALYRFVFSIVKRAFTQFLQRVLRLGGRVVFANFQTLVLSTPKVSLVDAASYIAFLKSAMMESPLLRSLSIRAVKYFSELIWMDKMNHAGMRLKDDRVNPDGTLAPRDPTSATDGSASTDDEGPFVPDYQLSLAEYLPTEVKQQLITRLISLALSCCTFKTNLLRSLAASAAENQHEVVAKEDVLQKCDAFLVELVEGVTQRGLLDDVTRLLKVGGPRYLMSKRPGSDMLSDDPALEYVKLICHLLALHPAPVSRVVHTMKTNLLKLLHRGPFDKGVEFVDPSRTFVLSNVMCVGCNDIIDIDLVRDPAFPPLEDWACRQCNTPFSKEVIEAQLVDYVSLRLMAYQVQDLQCTKCKVVKPDFLAKYCSCSGEYKPKTSPVEFADSMKTFLALSTYHNFLWLKETVEWVLVRAGHPLPTPTPTTTAQGSTLGAASGPSAPTSASVNS